MGKPSILLILLAIIFLGGAVFIYFAWTSSPKAEERKQDGAPVVADEHPDQIPPPKELSTHSFGNFTFSYPSDASLVDKVSWEGVACNGLIAISIPENDSPDTIKVFISTSPSTASTVCTKFNPNAKVLADYEKGYRTDDFEEVIHSQNRVTINNILMLRQMYSQGYWTDHGDKSGKKVFDTSNESSVDHQLRYVFFDGNKSVIISGWKAEKYINQIAHSVRLLK
jgi:hypothetical protein